MFKYINGSLATTLPRQYDRIRKKFNYTNTIKHLFVIELHGLFFRTVLYSGTPLYGHLVNMVTFFDRPAKRPRPSLIRSPRYYGQFFLARW